MFARITPTGNLNNWLAVFTTTINKVQNGRPAAQRLMNLRCTVQLLKSPVINHKCQPRGTCPALKSYLRAAFSSQRFTHPTVTKFDQTMATFIICIKYALKCVTNMVLYNICGLIFDPRLIGTDSRRMDQICHSCIVQICTDHIYESAVLRIFFPKQKEGSSVQWWTFSVKTYDSRMDKCMANRT